MIYSSQAHGPSTQAAEYLEGWQRARAELDNFRKRVTEGQTLRSQQARAAAVQGLLAVADHLQAVVHHVPPDLQNHAWVQGVLHVTREFEHVLQEQGVEVINQAQVTFDPTIHEAIGQEKTSGAKSGMVLEVIQPGYKLGDSVLKPARVKVSA